MKSEYEASLEEDLHRWDAELRQLKATAEETPPEEQLEHYKRIVELREWHQEAQARLNELRRTDDTGWEDFKAGVESAMDELERGIKHLISHIDRDARPRD